MRDGEEGKGAEGEERGGEEGGSWRRENGRVERGEGRKGEGKRGRGGETGQSHKLLDLQGCKKLSSLLFFLGFFCGVFLGGCK